MEHKVFFGNLSVTSGQLELLDYVELIWQAVKDNQNPRKTRGATYYFHNVGIGLLRRGDPLSAVIYGRIVKNIVLVSEQVLVGGELIPRLQRIDSSPSSFFVLDLADHRVSFMPETKFPPSLATFGNTLEYFVKKKHEEIIRQRYLEGKKEEDPPTLKKLRSEFPAPSIGLAPIADKLAIEAFVSRFEKISKVTVHIHRRNQDYTPGALFAALGEETAALGPSTTKFVATGGREGLDREATRNFVIEVAQDGYEDTELIGQDAEGARLSGSNMDYSLVRVIQDPPENELDRATALHQEYLSAKADGQIRVAARDANAIRERLPAVARENE